VYHNSVVTCSFHNPILYNNDINQIYNILFRTSIISIFRLKSQSPAHSVNNSGDNEGYIFSLISKIKLDGLPLLIPTVEEDRPIIIIIILLQI